MKSFAMFTMLTGLFSFFVGSVGLAAPVDLTKETLYVREGFSAEWLHALPQEAEPGWVAIPPGERGERAVRVRELKLDGDVERSFFSLRHFQDKTYTFVTRFIADKKMVESGKVPGIHLASIGGNWEIFVNGRLVNRELHLRPDGGISTWRGMRDVFFPVDPRVFRPGENILAFRIIGNPTFNDTGLYQSSPYFIDEYRNIVDFNSESIPLAFIFLYLFFGLYHIFLYLNRKVERYNLCFGLFAVVLFIYLFLRTHTVYKFILDTGLVFRLELISLFMLIPLAGCFLELIIREKISIVTMVYGVFCAVLILLVPFAPLPFAFDVLRLWQATALLPVFYYAFFTIGYSFIMRVRERHRESTRSSRPETYRQSIKKTITGSVVGNLVIGVALLFTTTVFDIIDAVFLSLDLVLTRYGFFFFVIGTALILANRFIFLHKRIEILNTDLERKLSELDSANKTISVSEEKYRLLVEGTNEGIFSLGDDWSFTTANRAFMKQIGIHADDMGTLKFQDIVFEDPQEKSVLIRLVEKKLEEFIETRSPFNLKMKLKSSFAAEPREFNVRLEFITIEGKNEILGRATGVSEDSLMEYFISERQNFSIGNYLITAEEISHRLVRNVAKYMKPQQVSLLRIGLREMIINAIEHGNLEIGFEEKSIETMSDNYMEFISARQNDPAYLGRKVGIEFSLNPERVAYKITDAGGGFDHAKMIENIKCKVDSEMLAHGRGITIAMNIFDQVTYNNKGNQVLLVKRFGGVQTG
ncbi:MAG TPA: ATP-binding protein [Spirochaetota bacterium]|nr:ATP-binding protein [Spirochaetota bacterium]